MSGENEFWREFSARRAAEWQGALSKLLRFNTVSGEPDPEAVKAWRKKIAEGFDYLEALGKELGFATRRYEDRVVVIEHAGPEGAPVLGFPIHLDVVPAGEGWTRDPFGGDIAEGCIWGRGAQDDKGPIIQAIYGLLGAREFAKAAGGGAGATFDKTVRIIVVSEEELGVWDDIPYYFQFEKAPDFSIVPDATFPITVGEKGFVNLQVDFEWAPAIGAEFSIAAGERPNVVPAKAKLVAAPALVGDGGEGEIGAGLSKAPKPPRVEGNGRVEAEFYGVGAHGSLPHKGYNAARDALAKASEFPALRGNPAGRVLAWLAQVAGDLEGQFLGIAHRHEKVGKTTVNLGVLRADDHSAHAVLNIRNPIGLGCMEVERRVREAVDRLGDSTSGIVKREVRADLTSREPIYVDPEQFPEWIKPMQAAYTAVTGRPTELMTIGGTTFAKAFPNAVCFGPVDENEEEELAHQADERITLEAMQRNVEIYGRAIAGIALK